MKYIRKPYEIKAWQYNGNFNNAPDFIKHLQDAGVITLDQQLNRYYLKTLSTKNLITMSSWIVMESPSDIHIINTRLFKERYTAVPDNIKTLNIGYDSTDESSTDSVVNEGDSNG